MTARFRPLPLLLATIATLLLAAFGATIAAEETQALKCSPSQCPPEPEEAPADEQPEPVPPPTRSMLVISVGWNHPDRLLESPLRGASQSYVDYVNGSVNNFFTAQATPAPFVKWQARNAGEYMIEPPNGMIPPHEYDQRCAQSVDTGMLLDGRDFIDSLVSLAEAKARQRGFNPDAYATVVIRYSNVRVHCFGGVQAGRHLLITFREATSHELGHYEGLGHASFLRCKDASGRFVTLSGDCRVFTYGDPYDDMGRTDRAFNAIHANQLGWLRGQFFDVTAGNFSRTYFLRSYTGSVRADRALRLRDGGKTYWLEDRERVGVDFEAIPSPTFAADGLVIHREPSLGVSQLLDMTPGSKVEVDDADDAPLAVGRSWDVPGGEMRITVNSASPDGVSVTLATRFIVPNVLGLEVERAYAILRNAGYNPAPWHPVIDQTCSYIGTIAHQDPAPGTYWRPEQPITLGVGELPPFPCP